MYEIKEVNGDISEDTLDDIVQLPNIAIIDARFPFENDDTVRESLKIIAENPSLINIAIPIKTNIKYTSTYVHEGNTYQVTFKYVALLDSTEDILSYVNDPDAWFENEYKTDVESTIGKRGKIREYDIFEDYSNDEKVDAYWNHALYGMNLPEDFYFERIY